MTAPGVVVVIVTLNGAVKKPRWTEKLVSATTPSVLVLLAAPGVGIDM